MPTVGPASASILIGRDSELAALDAFLNGASGVLLLSGEAGIGKSRLAREAISRAAARNYRVLSGACFERDQALPFAPFLDLLRNMATASPEAVRDLLRSAPGFRQLVPELAGRSTIDRPVLDPEQQQRHLFQEMRGFLAGLATEQPLLILLEDLHWSDETSLELLLYLIRRPVAARLAFLLSYRSDEGGPGLSRFLAALDRERVATEIALLPLASAHVAQLVRTILDLRQPAGAVFTRSLQGLTGGNPFFVEEVLRSLIVAGDLYPSAEGWHRKPLDQLRVPRSVEDAVQRRSALLSPAAREALTLAAVVGRRFDVDLLHTLSGIDETALIAALKELLAAHLLVELSADRFAFRHALTRQAVYAGLLARERRALHARVALAIEQMLPNDQATSIEELAYHHFEAEHWERAEALARVAGDRARAVYAPKAAAEHFTRALAAASRLGTAADPELLLARGRALDAIGDFASANFDFLAALAATEASGDQGFALASLLELGLLWSARDYDQAHAWILRALDLARGMDDAAALARVLNRLGNWHANREEIARALSCHEEALAIFERLEDRRGLAETFDLLAMTHGLGGDLSAAQAAATRAVALFEELGDRQGMAGTLPLTMLPGMIAEIVTSVGGSTLAESIATVERALVLAREIDWRTGETFLLALLGGGWAATGEFGRALALLQESIAIAEEIDHQQWLVQARWELAQLFTTMELYGRARDDLERVLASAQAIHARGWTSTATAGLASVLVALGEMEAAQTVLSETLTAETPMRAQGERLLWAAQAELALARDQPQDALAIVGRLYATAASLTNEGQIPRLAQLKATALAALGDASAADALLREAQSTAHAEGALPTLRALQEARARLLRGQGRADEASREEAAARAIAEQLAETLPEGALRAEFLRAAGFIADDPTAVHGAPPAVARGLTRREREVAAHIAAGRSNREIADALFVSERTVEAHVTNILRKLAVPSRAGIAAWAERQGIAAPGT
jgi:DNA-binding NarL/FixJ family response regulator